MRKSLSDKHILITGGNSCLGSPFVKQACAAGAKTVFTYRQRTAVVTELEAAGAVALACDLSDRQAIDAAVVEYRKNYGALDILIHNAAAVRDFLIRDLTEADWEYVLNVNLKAPYYLTKKLLPLLLKKKAKEDTLKQSCKKIFMVTSRVGIQGAAGASNYAAAKAGLIALTKTLAQELGKRNILVNAINPGFMKSRMTESLPEPVREKNKEVSLLKRESDPEEVAAFLVMLCSDWVTQVTGQVFHFESRGI